MRIGYSSRGRGIRIASILRVVGIGLVIGILTKIGVEDLAIGHVIVVEGTIVALPHRQALTKVLQAQLEAPQGRLTLPPQYLTVEAIAIVKAKVGVKVIVTVIVKARVKSRIEEDKLMLFISILRSYTGVLGFWGFGVLGFVLVYFLLLPVYHCLGR